MHFNQSGLYIAVILGEIVDGFFDSFAYGAHGDDNMLGLGVSIVIEKPIICSDFFINQFHVRFHQGREGIIISIGRFPGLEENIRVLGGTHKPGMVRV